MASGTGFLLDTNVLVHLLRADAAGRWLDTTYHLSGQRKHFLSVISIGELLRLAEIWSWGPARLNRIFELVSAFSIIDIHHLEILENYARIGVHWERMGMRLEQNDLWIAATVDAIDGSLLTTDTDFKKLDRLIQVDRKAMRDAYALVVAAHAEASARLPAGDRMVNFPEGTFPPGLPFVPFARGQPP